MAGAFQSVRRDEETTCERLKYFPDLGRWRVEMRGMMLCSLPCRLQ